MSAFICDHKTINRVLYSFKYINEGYSNSYNQNPKLMEILGQKLLDLNTDSVNYRYPDSQEPKEIFKYKETPTDPLQCYKSLQCLMYQSCEIENYKEDEFYKLMIQIKLSLADYIIRKIPEYEKKEW